VPNTSSTALFTTADIPPFFEFPTSYLVLDYARSALDLLAMAAFIPLVFLRRSNRYFTARRPPA
jgi:hypothetical protein